MSCEERVVIDVARPRVHNSVVWIIILDVAVGNSRRTGAEIVDLVGRVAPQDAVGHRRAAPVVAHPAAVVVGRVSAECAVRHRRAAVPIVHPAAVEPGRVSTERAVRHRRAGAGVGHPAAVTVCRVPAERAVGHRRAAVGMVVHPTAQLPSGVCAERAVDHGRVAVIPVQHPAAVGARVPAERAVGHRRAALVVVHPAAAVAPVPAERTVGHRRVAGAVVHPAAVVGRVSAERAVGHRWAAVVVVHPSTLVVRVCPVVSASGNGESVEDGRGVGSAPSDDVIAVVGVVARRSDVAAEDGLIEQPGAFPERALSAVETTVEFNAGDQLERGRAVRSGRRLVRTGGHPDLVAVDGQAQGGLQIRAGITPTGAAAAAAIVDVVRRLGLGGLGRHQHAGKNPKQRSSSIDATHDQDLLLREDFAAVRTPQRFMGVNGSADPEISGDRPSAERLRTSSAGGCTVALPSLSGATPAYPILTPASSRMSFLAALPWEANTDGNSSLVVATDNYTARKRA